MNNENKVHIHKAALPSPRLPLLWAPNLKGGHEGLFSKMTRKASQANIPCDETCHYRTSEAFHQGNLDTGTGLNESSK